MKRLFILLVLTVSACKPAPDKQGLPFYNTPDFTPVWLSKNEVAAKKLHVISPFSLTNQLGQKISNQSLKGKIYVANFFFASCGSICPRMMDNLAAVQAAFAADDRVRLVSHSVTPWRDSTAVLYKYAAERHINNKKWWLLTGDKNAIYTLARKSYFADDETGYNKSGTEFLHTENVLLIDGQGRIRGVYNGTLRLEIDNLINHIRQLEQE